jgi:hypothetical protein
MDRYSIVLGKSQPKSKPRPKPGKSLNDLHYGSCLHCAHFHAETHCNNCVWVFEGLMGRTDNWESENV